MSTTTLHEVREYYYQASITEPGRRVRCQQDGALQLWFHAGDLAAILGTPAKALHALHQEPCFDESLICTIPVAAVLRFAELRPKAHPYAPALRAAHWLLLEVVSREAVSVAAGMPFSDARHQAEGALRISRMVDLVLRQHEAKTTAVAELYHAAIAHYETLVRAVIMKDLEAKRTARAAAPQPQTA